MKKTLSIILAILMIVSTVPMAFAAGGYFGTNDALSWNLSADGTLTISGQGAMPEYGSSYDTPWWNSYRNDIKNIVVNEGVTNVGANALSYFPNLTSVSLSSTVTSLSRGALAGNTALTEITIPKNVSSVHEEAFFGCSGLTQFKVDSANQSFKVIDGVLFSKDGTKLCLYPVNKSAESYTVPSGTKTIERSAFRNNTHLKTLVISEGVEGIKYTAFAQASALTTVKFSSTVTIIDSFAFADCLNLTSVTFEEGLEKIYTGAFDNDTKLANAVLPSSVKTISEYAFEDCQTVHYLGAETDLTSFKSTGNGAIHFTTYKTGTASNCVNTGVKDSYFCSACNKTISGGETIPVDNNAHDFNTVPVTNRPAFNESTNKWEDGYYSYTCANGCGAINKVYADELKRADYTEYYKALNEFKSLLDNDLTAAGAKKITDDIEQYSWHEDRFITEQSTVDNSAKALASRTAYHKQYLHEYYKADFTQIDALVATINEKAEGRELASKIQENIDKVIDKLKDYKEQDLAATKQYAIDYLVEDAQEILDGFADCENGKHTFSVYTVSGDGSCLQATTETAYCDYGCGASDTRVISQAGHEYEYTLVNEATCTSPAIYKGVCSRCGDVLTGVMKGSALGHNPGNYISNGDATCTADGTKTSRCTRCSRVLETVPDVGSKKDHTFRSTGEVVREATCTENEVRKYECRYCDATEEREAKNTTIDHDFSVYVGVYSEATCQEYEYRTYECSYGCKTTKNEFVYGTLKDHVGGTATCIKAAVCENCGEEYGWKDDDNHIGTITLVDSKPGNCKEFAYEEYHCSGCKDTWVEYGDFDLNNHDMSILDHNEDTHFYACSRCYHIEERIPHTPGEWIYFPFIDRDGVEKYRKQSMCTVCGYYINEDITYEEYLEATQGETNNCDHLCHKDGFMGFIWKIVKFFSKLFKANPVCECGAAHY